MRDSDDKKETKKDIEIELLKNPVLKLPDPH